MIGISSNCYCDSSVPCLKDAGLEFVLRYYSHTTKQEEKVLTATEAAALSAAGIAIGVVYEDAGNKASYFDFAEGRKDGYYAYYYAQKLHQPGDSAIYFAVDYDASLSEIQDRIQDYFRGVFQGFQDFSSGQPIYKIGVYGSGAVCNWLKEHLPFVKFSWLAESTGWMDSNIYNDWDVKQFVTDQNICNIENNWERCEAKGDFGQFFI